MSIIDKLSKALDGLKSNDLIGRSGEKEKYCRVTADLICAPIVMNFSSFPDLLHKSMDSLFKMCDHSEANIRMVAEENLNRVVRCMIDYRKVEIFVELLKEIKKNDTVRRLRASLSRFGNICHLISPSNRKKFVLFLIPCIKKIAMRTEDPVAEILAQTFPKIMQSLGHIMSDSNIKNNLLCPLLLTKHIYMGYLDNFLMCNVDYNNIHLLDNCDENNQNLAIKAIIDFSYKQEVKMSLFSKNRQLLRDVRYLEMLLEAFVNNLVTDSSIIRRSSVTCIESLCLSSRKPMVFIKHMLLINTVLIHDINKSMGSERAWAESCVIIGILNSVKNIILYPDHICDNSYELKLESKILQKIYLQIFRFCCFTILHPDSNITMCALDTLTQMFLSCPRDTLQLLKKKKMLSQSKLYETEVVKMQTTVNSIKIPRTLAQSFQKSFHHSSSESLETSFVQLSLPRFEDEPRSISQSMDSTRPSLSSANSMTNLYSEFGDDSLSEVDSIMDNVFFSEYENTPEFDMQSITSEHSCHSASESVLQLELEFLNQISEDVPLNVLCVKIITLFLAPESSKSTRTGIKSSALGCLTEMLKIDPNLAFFNYNSSDLTKTVLDVSISYTSHEDHLLRGMAIKLVGTFIEVILRNNFGEFKVQINEVGSSNIVIADLINIITQGLKDDSYVCVCHSLSAVSVCLMPLLNSNVSISAIPILETILAGLSSYWLVKVKLLEIIENLSFMTVYFATNSSMYQDRVLNRIVFKYLYDNEYSVRRAASKCLLSIVHNCYYKIDYMQQDVITSWVCSNTSLYCTNMLQLQNYKFHNMYIEASLSRIINRLTSDLIKNQSAVVVAGCIEALTTLTNSFKSPEYSNIWKYSFTKGFNSNTSTSSCSGLFTSILSTMTLTTAAFDLEMHCWMLKLSSNLITELIHSSQNITMKEHKIDFSKYNKWFEDNKLKKYYNELWKHVLKLLNVFRNVILDYREPTHISTSVQKSGDNEKDKKNLRDAPSHSNYYYKLQSVVKSSYNNYKVSLENTSNEKFIRFLESVLDTLKTLLTFISTTECQPHVDRILLCLTSIFNLTPNYSSRVLAELFKCLTSKYNVSSNQQIFNKNDSMFIKNDLQTLCMYTQALQTPYECLSNFIDTKIKITQHVNKHWEDERDRRTTMSGKLYCASSENLDFSTNLKCFRPLTIKCLKEYVTTGDVELQSSILDLLKVLLQSKVNLNVIDPKHEFLNFVFSQFDYLENGLFRDPKTFISTIFQFFINLSEDKSQSNIIPEAIHLCDGLMASGYPPELYCIPGILPIVEYVYVLKSAFMVNSSDLKELEAQREMLFAMLLRLCQFNEVVSILSLVIMEGSEEKWKRQSRQLYDTLYTSLGGCKIQASLPSLINLLLTLHPSSYSIQQQLHVMFNTCYDGEKCTLEPWLNTVLSNLIIILIQKSEDLILLRISESDISISSNLFELTTQSDPLNASILNKNKFPGEDTFSKFLFRVIYLSTNDIILSLSHPQPNCESKVCLLSEFMLTCHYIVQSGNFPKVVNSLRNFLNDLIFITLHKNIMTLSMVYPLLVLHWIQLIGLLDHNDIEFWKSILNTHSTVSQLGRCFYLNIVQKGCFLILCEVLNKNINLDNQLLKWFLSECVIQLLEMGNETSIQELLNCIHKDQNLSLMHITAVKKKRVTDKLDLTNELLRSMNEAHPAHCGEVIKLILPVLLEDPHLALSQFASSIAIRKMEYLLALPISESSNQLSKEEILQILEYFKNSNVCIKNRYCILISLFNKFGTQCYDFSSVEIDQNKSVNILDIKNILIDKNWFFDQVKVRCCHNDCPSFESAKLLSNLPLQDIISIMHCNDFNLDILQYCFTVSTQITIKIWKSVTEDTTNLELCPLFLAARFILVEHIQQTCNSLPRFHQIFLPMVKELNEKQNTYKTRMSQLFEDSKFIKVILLLTPAISNFLKCVKFLSKHKSKKHIILMDSNKTLLKFTVLLFEVLKWKLVNRTVATSRIQLLLKCAYNIFNGCGLTNELCSTELGSISSSLVSVVEFITEDVLLLMTGDYYTEISDLVSVCRQISSLLSWVENSRPLMSNFPLNQLTCSVIQIISRHPMVNGFVRIPPITWKMLQTPVNNVDFNIPAIPIDVLQEMDVLKQYVSRLSVVGWNSKQQFEETWMTLLSVLVPSSETDIPKEEHISRIQASSAAVNGITQLFSQTLFEYYPGDTTNNKFLHISRDIPLNLSCHKWFVKLEEVNDLIYSTFSTFKRTAGKEALLDRYECRANIERIHDQHRYSYHQLSVKFLQTAITNQWPSSNNIVEQRNSILEMKLNERTTVLNGSGLDLNSCILLLKEVFNQWMEPKTRGSLSQINEMIKCLLVMSDLFIEKEHYIWMLNLCLDLSQSHHHEDLLLHQYVIIAAAKAMAISKTEDINIREKVLKLIDNGLKSNCRLTQLAALHGLLYLLEGCFIENNMLPNTSEIVQMAVDFVQKHLCTEYSMLYECEWQLCVISIAFYIVEHGSDNIEDALLMSLEGLTKLVSSSRHFKLYQALTQGFQRIIFVKHSNENIVEQITTLALDRLSNAPPGFSLPALQLLLSCIYAEHYNGNVETDIDPDMIVVEMEKISVMFERIKKGCLLEVEVTTVIMAKVLTDIFPASYVLMRVVSEFLSPNQPHPTYMCTVVNQIFEQLINESQLDLLQDWVITTLGNFTQGLQIPMAIYCLISFFISSSKNKWLRAIFPHVRLRLGRYEYEDRRLLCIAAMDFYHSLSNENQKQLYKESFQSSVKSKNPFQDIILCLE